MGPLEIADGHRLKEDETQNGLTVGELFAGVGGFRLGLERAGWHVRWSNQWEPSTKKQHANECYVAHFGKHGHSNEDICKVSSEEIPDIRLLVGGFPCQDYSVAATQAQGIEGKKGVLWWEINRIIREKRPDYILLENVDRLLKSPASQRGRDFGIMLACFRDALGPASAGYGVEWRVINAADYGFPQRRRRIFILAFKIDSEVGWAFLNTRSWHNWLTEEGFFAKEFPVSPMERVTPLPGIDRSGELSDDLLTVSDTFHFPFHNAGIMSEGRFYTLKVQPVREPKTPMVAVLEENVDDSFYISEEQLGDWRYAKGAKDEPRRTRSGFEYSYKEGAIPFPDVLTEPSRTILTSEGSRTVNRSTHVIEDPVTGRYRFLTPTEVERLCGFPEGWTDTGMPTSKRYFCMGNALVVGLIERMGRQLKQTIESSEDRIEEVFLKNQS